MKNKKLKRMMHAITGLRYGPIPNYGPHCSLWLCGTMSVTESLRRTRVFNGRVLIKATEK